VPGILRADYRPTASGLLHLVLQRHALGGGNAFRLEHHGNVRFVAMILDRWNVDIHGSHIQTAAGEVIHHALPDRVGVLVPAVTSGEGQKKRQEAASSHKSIITAGEHAV
jgi:hypothetical protein